MIHDFRQLSQAPVMVSKGLRLRQFTPGDAYELAQLHVDESLTQWLLDDVNLARQDIAMEFLIGLSKLYREQEGLGIWAIEREECRYTEDRLIQEGATEWLDEDSIKQLLSPRWYLYGWFNLTKVPAATDRVELGSRLHQALQGQQIACSVGQMLVDYAFEVLELSALNTHCHTGNRAALYCSSFLGFDHPEPVDYLGKQALCLSLQAYQWAAIKNLTSSARRRQSYQKSTQWCDAFAGAAV